MFGNGVMIGVVVIAVLLRPILPVQLVGRNVYAVVVIRTTGTVAHHPVVAALLPILSSILDFAWFSPSNDFFFRPKLMRCLD